MSLGGHSRNAFSVLAESSPQASPCLRASPFLPASPGLCCAAGSPIVYAQASPLLCPASPQSRGGWVFPHSPTSSAVHALPVPGPFLLPAAVPDLPQPVLSRTVTPDVVQPTLTTRVRSMTGPLPPEASPPQARQRNSVHIGSGLASGMMLSEQPRVAASNNPTCSPAMAPCASPPMLLRQLSPRAVTATGCTAPASSSVAMLPLALPAAAAGPTLVRTLSGGSSPGGGNWTTVTTQRRQPKPKVCQDAPPPANALTRLRTEGEAVDLYYSQKEEFVRGWTRDHKQSRSFKSKKQTDFQIDKRRQQSMRDRWGMEADELDY